MAVPEAEQKKLFAQSGNRCAFPGCQKLLVAAASTGGQLVVLGEAAHIVAESENGPRGRSDLSLLERNQYANLILVCSRHHQIIDADPATYTVELLSRYKSDHEASIQHRLGPVDNDNLPAPLVADTLYSTVLPVEQMPKAVFTAPCTLAPAEIVTNLGVVAPGEVAPYVQRAGLLIAFQDLTDLGNPFATVANPLEAQRIDPQLWWDDPDRSRWYMDLLNRTLNKLTGRRDLHLDKDHKRFYFAQTEAGKDRVIAYRPLNQQSTVRQVVWQPKRRATGEPRPYWLHRGVNLRFIRAAAASWVLALRPELRVTSDGTTSLEPRRIGGRVTRKKAKWFNYDLLGEVQFWRDYLGDSSPRIILRFGSNDQRMIISTNLLSCPIQWPGIPEEFTKGFKNVDYVDDLFSWAELEGPSERGSAQLDAGDEDSEDLDEDF